MQLSGAEPLIVLIHRCYLVVQNHVLQDLAVYVVALQGLAELAPAEDVATAGKPFVNHTDPWSVLVVSESEAKFDLLAAGHKHLDEEVQVGLVERYENDLVVLRYELFDHFYGLGIDPESLNVHPHIFVEIPEEEPEAVQEDAARHLLQLLDRCLTVEGDRVRVFQSKESLFRLAIKLIKFDKTESKYRYSIFH